MLALAPQVWNEQFFFATNLRTLLQSPLELNVFDSDIFAHSDLLGTGKVDLCQLFELTTKEALAVGKEVTVNLKPQGSITIRIDLDLKHPAKWEVRHGIRVGRRGGWAWLPLPCQGRDGLWGLRVQHLTHAACLRLRQRKP